MAPAPKRMKVGKRIRFEIFKRDSFTCQYCNRSGPALVLVLDHVQPLAAGGADAVDNLVRACEDCNSGKAARPLTRFLLNADRLRLHLNQSATMAEALSDLIAEQRASWDRLVGSYGLPSPPDDVIVALFVRYRPPVAASAIRAVALRLAARPSARKEALRLTDGYNAWLTQAATTLRGPREKGTPNWRQQVQQLGLGHMFERSA